MLKCPCGEMAQLTVIWLEEVQTWEYGTHNKIYDVLELSLQLMAMYNCWLMGRRGGLASNQLTTFVILLMRRTMIIFYDPSIVSCPLYRKSLTKMTRSEITSQIPIVQKEHHLFPMTLLENIRCVIKKDDCDHHDSFMLDFALPTPEHILCLSTRKHIFFSAKINGKLVLYCYMPINSNYDVGCLKFLTKAYPPCERFPKDGKMSQYLDVQKLEIALIALVL